SLGCTGSPSARTANLDALADEGHLFNRHFSTCPICQPSRASLLTGLYPPAHQLWTNGVALPRVDHSPSVHDRFVPIETESGLHLVTPTLGDIFTNAGYRTAAFGKMHLTPFLEDNTARREAYAAWKGDQAHDDALPYYGFETYEPILGHGPVNYWSHGGAYGRYLHEQHPDLGDKLNEHIAATRAIPAIRDLYSSPILHRNSDASWLAERVKTFIDQRPSDRPFCCFVGFPGPHHPFAPSHDVLDAFIDAPVADPAVGVDELSGRPIMGAFDTAGQLHHLPEPWRENARAVRRYSDAMIHEIDRAVGRIIEHLDITGLWDNTIVVFTSDHGDFLGDFGLFRKACLNASQLLRVPLIMRVPGERQEALAAQSDRPTSNTDILPTLAALAGVPLPGSVHGIDLTNGQADERTVFAYAYQTTNRGGGNRRLDNIAVFQGDNHYCYAPHLDMEELFDTQSDPHETRDLASEPGGRARAAELRGLAAKALMTQHCPGLGKVAKY
ncbi:MAG: sulfatase, partial [Candidatus Sumerlaeota bacterium]